MTSTLTVDLDRIIQHDFLGLNGTYHGFAFMPEQEAKGMDDTGRQREFERVRRMGLNIARTWYRPDWACGSSLENPFNPETPKMLAFYRWLDAMRSLGVDVALQAGWWFTRDTYYGFAEPDPLADIPRYTGWVARSLRELVEVRGYDHIKYLVLLTEPTSYETGIVPRGFTQWTYYARVMHALHERLEAEGLRGLVKTVGPNNSFGGAHAREAAADLGPALDILSGHDYNYPGYAEWHDLCRKLQDAAAPTGKPVWLDEYGKQDEAYRLTPDYGNYIAQAAAASLNAGNQSSFLWLLMDQQYVSADTSGANTVTNTDSFYNGVHRWGLAKWPADDIENPTYPYPHWYAFSMLSRALGGRNGTRVYAVEPSGELLGSATAPGGQGFSLLLINTAQEPLQVSARFSRPLGLSLHRSLYDPARIEPEESALLIPPDKTFSGVSGSLEDTLPPRAVAVYTTLSLD